MQPLFQVSSLHCELEYQANDVVTDRDSNWTQTLPSPGPGPTPSQAGTSHGTSTQPGSAGPAAAADVAAGSVD